MAARYLHNNLGAGLRYLHGLIALKAITLKQGIHCLR